MDRRTTLLGSAGAALLSQLQACGSGDANTGSVESAVATEWTPVSDASISEKGTADYRFPLDNGIWHIEINYNRHYMYGRVEMWEPTYDGSRGAVVVLGIAELVRNYVYESTHIIRPHHFAELTISNPNPPDSLAAIRLVLRDLVNNTKIDTHTDAPTLKSWRVYSSFRAGSDGVYRADYRVDFFSASQKHLASVHFRRKDKAISSLVNKIVPFGNALPGTLVEVAAGQTIYSSLSASEMHPGSRTIDRAADGRTVADVTKFHQYMDRFMPRRLMVGTDEYVAIPRFDPFGYLSGYSYDRPLFYYIQNPGPAGEFLNAAVTSLSKYIDDCDVGIRQFVLKPGSKTSPIDAPHKHGEQLMRILYGDKYVEDYCKLQKDLQAKVTGLQELDVSPLLRNLKELGLTIYEDGKVEFAPSLDAARKLQQQGQAQDSSSTWAGGGNQFAFSFQFGFKLPVEWFAVFDFPPLLLFQFGARFSVMLASERGYKPFNGDAEGTIKTYTIAEWAEKGVRFTITGTIGTPQIPVIGLYFPSAAFEFNFNLTIKDGKCRIDSIVIDPVLDSRVPDVIRPLLKKIFKNYNPTLFGGPANITGNVFKRYDRDYMTDYLFATDGISKYVKRYISTNIQLHQYTAADFSGLLGDNLNTFKDRVQNFVDVPLRNYSNIKFSVLQIELSPFRMVFFNGDVTNPDYGTKVIRKGFKGKCHIGYAPAAKVLNFLGKEWTFEATGKVFGRLAATGEMGFCFGGDEFQKAYGAEW